MVSVKTQNEVDSILEILSEWKNFFLFEVRDYEEWAIYMREKILPSDVEFWGHCSILNKI